jgi:SAM-dependent methyltransferase
MLSNEYVHGYSETERSRLCDQANTLAELLHSGTYYPPGSRVLEAGCGVGAQSVILARNNPEARFTSVDISPVSVEQARLSVQEAGYSNVVFETADIFNLPFEQEHFDHVFVCFVLEHLADPVAALRRLKLALKPGGSITVIEGDHGSTYFHPDSQPAQQAIQCLIEVQARLGGDSLIGRQLFPLLTRARFSQVTVSPRTVYADSSRPEWVEGFTRNTFIAMVEGVRQQALEMGLLDAATWDHGIRDLYRTAGDEGTFCYTFFKGTAVR